MFSDLFYRLNFSPANRCLWNGRENNSLFHSTPGSVTDVFPRCVIQDHIRRTRQYTTCYFWYHGLQHQTGNSRGKYAI